MDTRSPYLSLLLQVFPFHMFTQLPGELEDIAAFEELLLERGMPLMSRVKRYEYMIGGVPVYDEQFFFISDEYIRTPSGKVFERLKTTTYHEPADARAAFDEVFPMYLQRFKEVMSHYDYLDLVMPYFKGIVSDIRPEVDLHQGFISAHGDKCYGYMDRWLEKHHIPKGRGALLYLLTYTKALGDTPKHESYKWVVENYPEFLPMIQAAEEEAGIGLLYEDYTLEKWVNAGVDD